MFKCFLLIKKGRLSPHSIMLSWETTAWPHGLSHALLVEKRNLFFQLGSYAVHTGCDCWGFSQGGCISEPFRLITKFLVLLCLLPREYQRMSVGESGGASCDPDSARISEYFHMQPFLYLYL